MFDRIHMISMESGLRRMAEGARFMPARLVPARPDGSAPDRLIWAQFDDGIPLAPFTDEDFLAQAPDIPWFVTSLDDIVRVNRENAGASPLPLRGVVMQMSRCGSTLSRMLLGQIDRTLVLSEAMVVNSCVVGPAVPHLRAILRAVLSGKSGPFDRAYIKCTSWNILHADVLLDALDGPPAIFIHRDPLEVLASLHRSGSDWHSRLFIGGTPPATSPDPTTGNARFLAGVLEAALALEDAGRLRFVAYEDILDRFIDGDLPDHLGYEVDEGTRHRMLDIAKLNSKRPDRAFHSDRAEKIAIAEEIPAIRNAASGLSDLHAEACRRSRWNREERHSSKNGKNDPRR